jgi:restriction endonuclease
MRLSNLDGAALRVLLATLSVTDVGGTLDLERIAFEARTTERLVRTALFGTLGLSGQVACLSPEGRLRLAMEIARMGEPGTAAKALTWQEFERFSENCLEEAGFEAKRNVRVKGEGRAWQIDVVGFRGELVLAIDCKHWNTPGYLSRFKLAASRQRRATSHLLMSLNEKTTEGTKGWQALAVILTVHEPPALLSEDTVLVSVEKLPGFLSGVTPYDETLPFMVSHLSLVENPMSQSQ